MGHTSFRLIIRRISAHSITCQMSSSRLTRTAFPLEYIHSLPTIEELVKQVRACKRENTTTDNPGDDTTDPSEDEADDFILVQDWEASSLSDVAVPYAEMSEMSIDGSPRTSPFIDMLIRESKEISALSRTENSAVIYSTSLQPLVDLFYAVNEESEPHIISSWLMARPAFV